MDQPMGRARQKQILDITSAAFALPAEERTAFVAQQCGQDVELAEHVLELLRQDEQGGVLDLDAVSMMKLPAVGEQIGEYTLIHPLGKGGMGTVYLAERTTPEFSRQFALKIVNAQIIDASVVYRFETERSVLAQLHHPYIASLIDGGTTSKGVPYLVMEWIPGLTITEYCDKHCLSVDERMTLLVNVCAAVQFAHQNLVVHRDIKPANILVTEEGTPKLLDFGIAKLLREDVALDEGVTQLFGRTAITPEYASPELINGEVISTLTDVYSLGVLAWEVLLGSLPYSLTADASPNALRERFAALPPLRIDNALRNLTETDAQNRSTSLIQLRRRLSGDPAAVVMRALCPEPERRYRSAEAFAEDLERARLGQPVIAKGDSPLYRARRFIGRHRLVTAGSLAAFVGLSIGLSTALWQANIAQHRFEDLHDLSSSLMGEIYDAVADVPGATAARHLILSEAQHYLDRLSSNVMNDTSLTYDIALAYKRLGDVTGLPSNQNLGNSELALESYANALRAVAALSESQEEVLRLKALIYEKRADVLAWQGLMGEALRSSEVSAALFARVVEQHATPRARLQHAISAIKRGDLLGHPSFANVGQKAEAIQAYETGLTRLLAMAQEPGELDLSARRYLGLVHERLGTMFLAEEQTAKALHHYTISRDLRLQLSRERPLHFETRRDVGIATEKMADSNLALGNIEVAIGLFRSALATYADLLNADPTSASAKRTMAYGHENLAQALVRNASLDEARVHYQDALALRRALVERDPLSTHLMSEMERSEREFKRIFGDVNAATE